MKTNKYCVCKFIYLLFRKTVICLVKIIVLTSFSSAQIDEFRNCKKAKIGPPYRALQDEHCAVQSAICLSPYFHFHLKKKKNPCSAPATVCYHK